MGLRKTLIWVFGGLGAFGILCCATPILPLLLGAIGAGGLTAVLYHDAVLLPFAALMFLAAGGLLLTGRRR